MSFGPRMENRIEGFSVAESFHRRYWDGMAADLWGVDCAPRAGGYYVGSDPRLFIMLDSRVDVWSGLEGSFTMGAVGLANYPHWHRRAISFIPAGMEMQANIRHIGYLRHLDLHFDADSLFRRLGEDFDRSSLEEPRLLLREPRLIALADLIAAECSSGEPLHGLYGEGLTLSLIIDVLKVKSPVLRRRSQLAGWQLKRATEFIEDNCMDNIRLDQLAKLVGLSPSYFSHAFKASTGLAPHQWQMRARINRVKRTLVETDISLTMVATNSGFSDAAHFSRIFRKEVGITPSAWRREQRTRR